MKSLAKMAAGERAYIVDMRNSKLCEKLFELGVFPGDMVEVKQNCMNSHSMVVSVNNKTYNIYRPAAETILTNSVSFQINLN